ncbi:MAG TPA: hypothetical protein VHT74_19160 [Acetobacteraceae bacterium]|jgi:hypothetical protein|nr:hypothetical protein [Acetobacteraceae bacterium]
MTVPANCAGGSSRLPTSSEGWTDYRWLNPETKRVGPKVTYLKRAPDTDMIVSVGIDRSDWPAGWDIAAA